MCDSDKSGCSIPDRLKFRCGIPTRVEMLDSLLEKTGCAIPLGRDAQFPIGEDPISAQVRIKELETGLRAYLAKQLTTVETAIVTAIVTAHGAFIRALMISHVGHCHLHPLYVLKNMFFLHELQAFAGGPLVQARNFVVMTGTNAGISCVMKRIRGVEDMHSSMVAAFGSGAMFSLVSGIGGSNQAVNAVTSGLFFALIQGGISR
ncbi:hypothetical protein ZIOFF_013418 [Zingiber officinale]|uniref:Uncharacterized protein n=1 Tax=Zingiber officinale TaxID=94328 RepID=A0A8J5HG12_ZINOF|nr:hypothetical protein ZIOFF_013418 [Zingiber officinale]